jgi:tetratricopeptide (TPR) repeat protein
MTSSVLIGAHLALLEPRQALAASDRAWAAHDRIEDAHIQDALSINRARALAANGRPRDAGAVLDTLVHGLDPERDTVLLAMASGERARIEYAAGHWQTAADLALSAIPALQKDAGSPALAKVWLVGIRALRAAGRAAQAVEQTRRLTDWARSSPPTLQASLAQAEWLVATRRIDDAGSVYDAALASVSQAGVPADIAEVAISYGSALVAAAQLARASAIVGRVARWADRDFDCAVLQTRLYAALGQRTAWQQALVTAHALAGDRPLPIDLATLSATPARPPGEQP